MKAAFPEMSHGYVGERRKDVKFLRIIEHSIYISIYN